MRCNSQAFVRRLGGVLVICLLGGLAGCSPAEEEKAIEQETSNLRQLAIVLGSYTNSHQGRYPVNEEDLRKFIESQGRDPDELLTSDRDGKQVVIVYQGDRGKITGNRSVVAYEQEGKDGQRMIVGDLGDTDLVSEEEFRKLVPNP